MSEKYSAYGCRTWHDRKKKVGEETENAAKFHFPLGKPELLKKNEEKNSNMNRDPGNSAVIHEKHFK